MYFTSKIIRLNECEHEIILPNLIDSWSDKPVFQTQATGCVHSGDCWGYATVCVI